MTPLAASSHSSLLRAAVLRSFDAEQLQMAVSPRRATPCSLVLASDAPGSLASSPMSPARAQAS